MFKSPFSSPHKKILSANQIKNDGNHRNTASCPELYDQPRYLPPVNTGGLGRLWSDNFGHSRTCLMSPPPHSTSKVIAHFNQ